MHALAGTGKIQDPERVVTRTGSAALLFPFGRARCGRARSSASYSVALTPPNIHLYQYGEFMSVQPAKNKKSHGDSITATVVVVFIALVAGLVWFFVGRTAESADTDRIPVPADGWTQGTEERWSLTVDAGPEDYLYTSDTYMVLIDVPAGDRAETAELTSWRIDGDDPEKLANVAIDYKGPLNSGILGSRFINADTSYDMNDPRVFNILTGKEEDNPWDNSTSVALFGDSLAVSCNSHGECSGYDAALKEIWSETIEPHLISANTGTVQSDGEVDGIACWDASCKIIDFVSGEVITSEFKPPSTDPYPITFPFPLRDGWAINYLTENHEYSTALVNTEGKLIAEIAPNDDNNKAQNALISAGGSQTLEDLQRMEPGSATTEDGLTISGTGADCDELVINDKNLGEDPFHIWSSDGNQCNLVAFPPMTSSAGGDILAVGTDYQYSGTSDIQALIDTKDGVAVWQAELTGPYGA